MQFLQNIFKSFFFVVLAVVEMSCICCSHDYSKSKADATKPVSQNQHARRISENDIRRAIKELFSDATLASEDRTKWNPLSFDFDSDGNLDEVIWLKTKMGNDQIVMLLQLADGTIKREWFPELDSDQKFCGVKSKEKNAPGLASGEYCIMGLPKEAEKYKASTALEVFYNKTGISSQCDCATAFTYANPPVAFGQIPAGCPRPHFVGCFGK